VLDDTARVGPRVEPRVSPAHFIDRLLPACPSCRAVAFADIGDALAVGIEASTGRSQGERLPIVGPEPSLRSGFGVLDFLPSSPRTWSVWPEQPCRDCRARQTVVNGWSRS
jgi:hypothetical protein